MQALVSDEISHRSTSNLIQAAAGKISAQETTRQLGINRGALEEGESVESNTHQRPSFPNQPPWIEQIQRLPNPFTKGTSCHLPLPYPSLQKALAAHSSQEKIVILAATVDGGYLDMALNFYELNMHRLNITNFVFMCIDHNACTRLQEYCIPSYLYTNVTSGGSAHSFYSKDFQTKCKLKLGIVHEALQLGYNVLLSDVDVAFLKNPLHHLDLYGGRYDIQIQIDRIKSTGPDYNSGFMYIRNNQRTLEAFRQAVESAKAQPNNWDQNILNEVFKRLERSNELRVNSLPQSRWPSGGVYFGLSHGGFYDTRKYNSDVIVVHNNWIQGLELKIYRFKEHLMWMVDTQGYYSSPHRQYITYDNPVSLRDTDQVSALRSALGIALLLNRTLIVPRFHCGPPCSLLRFRNNIEQMTKQFPGMFRESTFLLNPRITPDLLESQSPKLIVQTGKPPETTEMKGVEQHILTPREAGQGASSEELLRWLEPYSHYRILHFSPLMNAFGGFTDATTQTEFQTKIRNAKLG